MENTHVKTIAPKTPNPTDANDLELLHVIAEAALDKKVGELTVLDVRGLVTYTDYFVIGSGTNDRQVKAIANGVLREMRDLGYRPLGVEGTGSGRWVVIDFGDYVIHIFHDEEREKYGLEKLWSDAPRVALSVDA